MTMSETGQQKGVEGDKSETTGQKVETPEADISKDDQKVPRGKVASAAENDASTGVSVGSKAVEDGVAAAGNHGTRPALLAGSAPLDTPVVKVEPTSTMKAESQPPPSASMQVAPTSLAQSVEGVRSIPTTVEMKAGNSQAAMLASVKAAQQELGQAYAIAVTGHHEQRPAAKGKKLKCKSCKRCNDERVPVAIFQSMEGGRSVAIRLSPQCGHACTIVINNAFEITEHVCTSYIEAEAAQGTGSDFDFDRFIAGGEELDDFLLRQKTKQTGKLVTLEDQMKVAVKKLAKPLALLVPTGVQRKSEAQLRTERDDRLRLIVEIEANTTYLRVLEFEKAAAGGNSYQIDKLSKMLKSLDKKFIVGFIQKVDNDFLISYNEKTQTVHFYHPSKPELEILSREFEKWLRFNRL